MTVLVIPSVGDLVIIPLFGIVIGLAVGCGVCVLWSPFLLSDRIRQCFRLGPTPWWQVNYVITFVLIGTVHASFVLVGLLYAHDPVSTVEGLVGPALVVPGVALLGVASLLQLRDGDPDPTDFDASTLGLLALGAVWYALLTGIPSFVATRYIELPI